MPQDFDWNDLRLILAVVRRKSLRGGADLLGMHHSSVARRISAFEAQHGLRVFERRQRGYVPTPVGEAICRAAEDMENAAVAVARQTAGHDARLSGHIKLTLPPPMAAHLLLPDIMRFADRHPEIDVDVAGSSQVLDLSRLDADVAIRVSRRSPPDHLIGRRAGKCAFTLYENPHRPPDAVDTHFDWSRSAPMQEVQGGVAGDTARVRFNDMQMLIEACRAGHGRASLPCFIGDTHPDLQRVPCAVLEPGPDIWILAHRDVARTARIAAFTAAMWDGLRRLRLLLEGQAPKVA